MNQEDHTDTKQPKKRSSESLGMWAVFLTVIFGFVGIIDGFINNDSESVGAGLLFILLASFFFMRSSGGERRS